MFQWRKVLVSSLLVSGLVSLLQEEAHAQKTQKLEKPAIVAAETINMYKKTTDYSIKGKGISGADIKLSITDGTNTIVSKSSVKKDGTFQVPVNFSKLKDGTLTLSIIQTKGGKSSDTMKRTILKDTKAPDLPTLTSNLYINSKNQSVYIVKGKTEPLSSVYVSIGDVNNIISKNGKVDSKGNFTLTFDLRKLQDGKINVSAGSVDAAGNKSRYSKAGLLTKDVIVEEPIIFSEEYVNSFNVDSYPIAGTGTPGEKVQVVVKDGTKSAANIGEVDELGNYSVELDLTSLKDGNLTIEAKQIDKAGNESKVVKEVLKKDVSIPSPAIIFNKGFINEDTDMTSYTVIGRGLPGSELEVTLSDGVNEVSSLGAVEENGEFSIEADISPLNDGEITISVIQISPAGNVAETAATTVFKDTKAPGSPTLSSIENISQLNVSSYPITGTGEAAATVYITVTDGQNSLLEKIKTDQAGNFSIRLDVSSLSNGEITIVAVQKDAFGNISDSKAVRTFKTS